MCPECGFPNNSLSHATDIRGYATECSCCGAPSNGLRICQWCGSAIHFLGASQNKSGSNNRTILECEFKRVANDRNLYPYIICHVTVNGHELMQLRDEDVQRGLTLALMGVRGLVYDNFVDYAGMHSFYRESQDVYSRVFGIDYISAAQVADEILTQVYEVTDEQVMCNYEYGQANTTGNDSNVAAAAVGGAILGAFLGNF